MYLPPSHRYRKHRAPLDRGHISLTTRLTRTLLLSCTHAHTPTRTHTITTTTITCEIRPLHSLSLSLTLSRTLSMLVHTCTHVNVVRIVCRGSDHWIKKKHSTKEPMSANSKAERQLVYTAGVLTSLGVALPGSPNTRQSPGPGHYGQSITSPQFAPVSPMSCDYVALLYYSPLVVITTIIFALQP